MLLGHKDSTTEPNTRCLPNADVAIDVAKLKHCSSDKGAHDGYTTEQPRDIFQQLVRDKLCPAGPETNIGEYDIEQQWSEIRTAMYESAETALGFEKKKHPDWFREIATKIKPLLTERNRLYLKWRNTMRKTDHQNFAKMRSRVRREIREVKNAWFLEKAIEAQRGRNGGKLVWRCIRDIQRARRGHIPMRSAVVCDKQGNACTTPEEQQQRWKRHFSHILNIQSSYDEKELQKVKQRPPRPTMSELPTEEELLDAISTMKNGKAGGQSGILPEMVKAASNDDYFLDTLLTLVQQVWKEGKTPQDRRDALLVPIPKKGDLTKCDNWRGIALLDVVGKAAAKVLQGRLQQLAEEVLPESQCGFRRGRSCTDMVFFIRQLIEKSWEHKAKLFVTFIDLSTMGCSWETGHTRTYHHADQILSPGDDSENPARWKPVRPIPCGKWPTSRMLYGTHALQPIPGNSC